MKFSLFENDKSTCADEIILGLIVLISAICGILLIVFRPEFLFISLNIMVVIGVMLLIVAIMFLPGLVYRLMTNDKKTNK